MKKVGTSRTLHHHKTFCNYIHRFCNQTRLDGYSYCIRHILEDKSAPFRQCSFVHPQNRKRCANAAEKNEKRESLCPWHSKRAVLNSKPSSSKKKPAEGPATVLANFENFCQDKNHNPLHKRSIVEKDRKDSMLVDSICDSDFKALVPTKDSKHSISLDETYIGGIEDDSEDIDSEEEDCLKHAGVYTAEEVIRITKEKVFRLQSLYIDELKRLKHTLYESRQRYLQELSAEQEVSGSLLPSQNFSKKNENLEALMKYHCYTGTEALLHMQSLKARGLITTEEVEDIICNFSTKEKKCQQKAIIYTQYCMEHILCDPNQLIYKQCSGDGKFECRRPILDNTDSTLCSLHTQLVVESDNTNVEDKKEVSSEDTDFSLEAEHFLSMDDIASLGLDVVTPGSLFGLDQFGEPGESTDTVLSEDQTDLMQIQPMSIQPPDNILNDSRKSESDSDK